MNEKKKIDACMKFGGFQRFVGDFKDEAMQKEILV